MTQRKLRLPCAVIAYVICAFFAAEPLYAQAPPNLERATYETDVLGKQAAERARPRPEVKPVDIEEEPEPEVEDAETFPVTSIVLEGVESFPPESFAGIVGTYEDRAIGINAIQRLCKQIEREYLKRGVIAAVFAPPQDIKEGVLTLRVIEAKMGELNIVKACWFSSKRLEKFWPIKKGDVLRYDQISRSIQFMNKNPDREVKAALHAGSTPGSTDVTLTPETQMPVHLSFTYDNDGSPSTGTLRTGFGARHNNFLGHGDIVMTGYTYGKDFGSVYAYHNLPISTTGAILLYGFSKSTSKPKKDYLPFDMRTWADKADFSVHQDIYKKDEYLGEVYAEFSMLDKRTYANTGGTINRDRLRTLSFGGTYLMRALGATAVITPEFTQGLGILGASPEGSPLLTRGAEPVFSKFSVIATMRNSLPFNLTQLLKMNAQFASRKLNPSEGLSFGGISSIRGYPAGDVIVDNGFIGNLEVLSPLFFLPDDVKLPYARQPLKQDVKALAFFDYGYGRRRAELKQYHEAGIGGGLRVNFYDQATMRMEWGYPVADHPLTNGRAWFFHFALSFNDTLPEEMKRIAREMDEARVKKAAQDLLEGEMRDPDSPLRRAFYGYYGEAQAAEREGRLEDAEAWYGRILSFNKELYAQAEEYVRACKAHEAMLKAENKRAAELYGEGKVEEAEAIWKRVMLEAKMEPFALRSERFKSWMAKQ